MRKSSGAGKKKEADAIDEVEELLKLTQQDLLLNLSINSHIKSKSQFDFIPEASNSNAIDPDLDRRFQALRSKTQITSSNKQDVDVDNLFARFSALKTPNASNSTIKLDSSPVVDVEDEDEEDEVQKIINWAKDAARLDPSPSSEIDESDDNDDKSDDDESDDDNEAVASKKKGSKK
ncbi:hypothetical protein QVD17_02085 [Tagetes erecta]|uniref:Uncharacterized protein n=1 Tax=Tagetes erecta TaxID=13708 RepID=A0AAD8P8U9_TARER|nr:hypothetical protein QVD17_02085 [Tagetes erecta]